MIWTCVQSNSNEMAGNTEKNGYIATNKSSMRVR